MYTPNNRSFSCAVAAVFVAGMLTFATVAPVPAHAETGTNCAKVSVTDYTTARNLA